MMNNNNNDDDDDTNANARNARMSLRVRVVNYCILHYYIVLSIRTTQV